MHTTLAPNIGQIAKTSTAWIATPATLTSEVDSATTTQIPSARSMPSHAAADRTCTSSTALRARPLSLRVVVIAVGSFSRGVATYSRDHERPHHPLTL